MSYLKERNRKSTKVEAPEDDASVDVDVDDAEDEPKKAEKPKKDDKKDDKKKGKKTIAFKEFDPSKYVEINPVTEAVDGNKKIVVTFGRMNPPTTGHSKLVRMVAKQARRAGADSAVYLSHSQDKKKNPLSYKDKIKFAKAAFGSIVKNSKARNIIEVLKELDSAYSDVIIVVGSDRVKEFDTLANKYNGKEYNFKSINTVSAGDRDPDAEGVTGMSASKMRQMAADGEAAMFMAALPDKLAQQRSTGREVYDLVRKGMGLPVGEEIDEAMTPAQRRKAAIRMKKLAPKIARKKAIAMKRKASTEKLKGRAQKAALKILKKKIAGGKDTDDMSYSQRQKIDDRLKKIPKAKAKQLAKKLLPAIKKKELERIQKMRSKKEEDLTVENILELQEMVDQYMSTDMLEENRHAKIYARPHRLLKQDNTVKIDYRFKSFKRWKPVPEPVAPTPELDEVQQDGDIKDKEGSQPKKYYSGLDKKTKEKRNSHFARKAKMSDDDPKAYTPAPGDKEAKTKPSKHTKKYHQMFGEETVELDEGAVAVSAVEKEIKKNGGTKVKKDDRSITFTLNGAQRKVPVDRGFVQDRYYMKLQKMFEEVELDEDTKETLQKKAKETGISYAILKKVFDRGVAAWRTGHRPGTTPVQWGFARVNSYATKGKTYHTADSDLRESKEVEEGVNDPAIFKAIFLAGGPGSGKSFIVGKTALSALGMRVVNSDDAFENAMKKAGLSMKTDTFTDKGQALRSRAVDLTKTKQEMYLKGRLGLVIDGTGKDYKKIKDQAMTLKKLGYDVGMILVNTDKDTALARNDKRARSLPADQVSKMWDAVQKNVGRFQGLFGSNFTIVDNSEGSNWEAGTQVAYKWAAKFTRKPPSSPVAKKWIKMQREAIEESTFEGSIIQDMLPWLARWIDTKVKRKAYTMAIKHWLKLRKKNPGDARKNLVKTAQTFDLDVRALDKMFRDLVAKGAMPKHLVNYTPTFKEEGGAGYEGTPELVKKYKKDTPGEK